MGLVLYLPKITITNLLVRFSMLDPDYAGVREVVVYIPVFCWT